MFTHARCGGVLVPIEKPVWWPKSMGAHSHGYLTAVVARCRRCRLAGEVVAPDLTSIPPAEIDLDAAATMLRSTLEHLIAHLPEDDLAFMDIPKYDKGSVGRPRTREGASFPTEQVQP